MKGDFTRFTWNPENSYSSVRMQQGRVQVDADWNEQAEILQHLREAGVKDLVGPCGAPLTGGGFELTGILQGDLRFSSGPFYVDGILCTAPEGLTYRTQAYYPEAPLPPDFDPPPAPLAGMYLIYLDVWRRHVSAVEDPSIRERALGGPDTATREQTVCQVKLFPAGPGGQVGCGSEIPGWEEHTAPSSGRLRARTQPGDPSTDPCIVPAQAGYTRLENQLYRVEVHDGGTTGKATFKWSRDNGSVVTAWVGQNPAKPEELQIASAGNDKLTGFHDAQWVELSDDTRELHGRPGVLVRVVRVEGETLEIDPRGQSIALEDFPRNPRIRRWDLPASASGALRVTTPQSNEGYLELESGLEVRFERGTYRTGDFWVIPARAFVGDFAGDIEWPQEGPGQGEAKPPLGIEHHFCKLGLIAFDGEEFDSERADCRPLFPALTELTRFYKVGGEGQEALPGAALACPLQVAVTNGEHPVHRARVRFRIPDGAGSLLQSGNPRGNELTVSTGPDGRAECGWQLPQTAPGDDGIPSCLQVEATLLDDSLAAPAPPLSFSARLSEAAQVAFDPRNCPPLQQAGASTVQQAIDVLCRNLGRDEEGLVIKAIRVLGDDIFVRNDQPLEPRLLARGLMVECDGDVDPRAFFQEETEFAVPAKPNFVVSLDLPYPLGSDNNFWDISGIVGFQELILRGQVDVEGPFIRWRPHGDTQNWLNTALFNRLLNPDRRITDRLLGHLRLKGNFIWEAGATKEPELYLDGTAFGHPTDDGISVLRLPSGDRRRGGDFDMWFWLQGEEPPGLVIDARPGSGSITGTVRDASGAAFPGVAVSLASLPGGTSRTATTTQNGAFLFRGLPNGRYRLTARSGGLSGQTTVTVGGIFNPPVGPVNPGRPIITEIPGIGPVFAGRLEGAGIRTAEEMAEMEIARLAEVLEVTETRAEALRKAAREVLG